MEQVVQIERVGREGQGVGSDSEGNLYFVPGALPGDRVRVLYRSEKRYRESELVEVLEPSTERKDPECVYFGTCGGCDWLHWEYSAQVKAKESILSHLLNRSGWEGTNFKGVIPSDKPLHYRQRIQLHQRGTKLGFCKRGSGEIVEIETCLVARPELNAAIALLKDQSADSHKRRVELISGEDDEVQAWVADREGNDPTGFLQIHPEQNEELRKLVGEAAKGSRKVLELYCGNETKLQICLEMNAVDMSTYTN